MSVLSFPYLILSGASSIFLWLFSRKNRKYTTLLVNAVFLYLIAGTRMNVLYVLILTVWVFFFGKINAEKKNKGLFFLSLLVPVISLGFFKYNGSIAMPLGVSFYTFKAISYLADCYMGKCTAQPIVNVFDYICFFPVFMAGPINRPEGFFTELEQPLVFDYKDQRNGCILAGLGLFEKLVIADELKRLVSLTLDNAELGNWYTVLGVILYSFQIYTDFDAYSNIAVGTARMMGFHIDRNFHAPYLSSDIKEFWRRWHISLSTWLKDYIYIPLGGNRKGTFRKYLNILIVFLVSGIWHGNTKMFVIWGLGHGILSVLESLILKPLKEKNWAKYLKPLGVIVNFIFVTLLWIFFRAPFGTQALQILENIHTAFHTPFVISYETMGIRANEYYWMFIMIAIIIVSDLFRYHTDMLGWLENRNIVIRWVIYWLLMTVAIIFGVYGPGYNPADFIYVTF